MIHRPVVPHNLVTVPIWQHILSAGRRAAKHASLRYADAPNDGATAITSVPPPPQLRLKQRPPFTQVKLNGGLI